MRTIRKSITVAICLIVSAILPPPVWAVEALVGPTLTMNPGGATPLAGLIELTTDVQSRVRITVTDGTDSWAVVFPDMATVHTVPLLGLKPDNTYAVGVSVIDESGAETVFQPTLYPATPPLPDDFPTLSVYYADPSKMEPGFTLMDKFRRVGTTGGAYSIIANNNGDVVWYSPVAGQDGMRQLPNGKLLLLQSEEVDLLGNISQPRTLDVPGFFLHHEMFPMANGNFLSVTLEKVVIENYPGSEIDSSAPTYTGEITSDAVVEFAPDGSQLNVWHLTDMLDPHRIGYDSTKPGFPLFDTPDWSHANGVIYDESDDSIIVSLRHQDAVIKFSRATGQLIWILGTHANWGPAFQPYLLTPVGDTFDWQYHQHAPMLTPSGTLLLMDNGNHRASPFDGTFPDTPEQSYSRAVEYDIDESTMEVRQVWEYGKEIDWRIFTASQGDADFMPSTGNVLITFSDTSFIAGGSSDVWGFGAAHSAVIEVDRSTSPAKPVFDMRLYNADPNSKMWVYRSERIPSLYGTSVKVVGDSDFDTVFDDRDNCTTVYNWEQIDTDGDGYGNSCDPDLNNDGVVEYVDLALMSQRWSTADPDADLDSDGIVSWTDLTILIDGFFTVPGPSGLAP